MCCLGDGPREEEAEEEEDTGTAGMVDASCGRGHRYRARARNNRVVMPVWSSEPAYLNLARHDLVILQRHLQTFVRGK